MHINPDKYWRNSIQLFQLEYSVKGGKERYSDEVLATSLFEALYYVELFRHGEVEKVIQVGRREMGVPICR